MLPREKTLLLLALSGPIIIVLGIAALVALSPWEAMMTVLFSTVYLGFALALAGLAACIVRLVNPKNRGRPKLPWVLLGLLDGWFAFLFISLLVIVAGD